MIDRTITPAELIAELESLGLGVHVKLAASQIINRRLTAALAGKAEPPADTPAESPAVPSPAP